MEPETGTGSEPSLRDLRGGGADRGAREVRQKGSDNRTGPHGHRSFSRGAGAGFTQGRVKADAARFTDLEKTPSGGFLSILRPDYPTMTREQ